MEREVIADIARRIKKMNRYTETAELMAKHMREQGYSPAKINADVMKLLRADEDFQRAIAENTKAYKAEIQKIIEETVEKARQQGKTLIAEAGNMAWNNDLSMWELHGERLSRPNTMTQLMMAYRKQTNNELQNLTRTTGFKNAGFGITGVQNAYQKELDRALVKVASGTWSYDQAVNDCIKRLAQSGLRSVDYASGRTYQLDTAARMAVRTGASQLSGRITEENIKSTGVDLVITSQHMGSRPDHAPWQNKVFSYSGKNKKYPDFVKETGYGSATGIKGTNCAHDFYPFWEGSSVIPADIEEPEPVEIDGKEYTYYQATQQQRKMEREIRATKREIEAQKAIGGETKELDSKLRTQMWNYYSFSEKAKIRPKDNRLGVISGSSDLTKLKRKLENSNNNKSQYLRNNLPKKFIDPRHIGSKISGENLERLTKKAEKYGIKMNGFEQYCGDVEIIESILEHINGSKSSMIFQKLNYKKILLSYDNVLGYQGDNSKIDIGAFAETKGHTIILNKFMFDDSNYLISQYNEAVENGLFAKGTSYLNISDHEMGHMLSAQNPRMYNKVLAVINEIAYNEKKEPRLIIQEKISRYAKVRKDKYLFSELIPELCSMANGNQRSLALRVLRKAGVI